MFACVGTTCAFPYEPSCYLSLLYLLRQILSLTVLTAELTKPVYMLHVLYRLYLPSCAKLLMCVALCQATSVGTCISTPTIMLEQQAFYTLNHLPSPENMIYGELKTTVK